MPASILVVEDDIVMRDGVCEILELAGYTVNVASNGKEALELLEKVAPELIVSDIMMPKLTGYQLVEVLKAEDSTSHIPIILLTAKSTQEDKISGLKAGADAYLVKPFNKEELLVRVENLIKLRNDLRTRFNQLSIKWSYPLAFKSFI